MVPDIAELSLEETDEETDEERVARVLPEMYKYY